MEQNPPSYLSLLMCSSEYSTVSSILISTDLMSDQQSRYWWVDTFSSQSDNVRPASYSWETVNNSSEGTKTEMENLSSFYISTFVGIHRALIKIQWLVTLPILWLLTVKWLSWLAYWLDCAGLSHLADSLDVGTVLELGMCKHSLFPKPHTCPFHFLVWWGLCMLNLLQVLSVSLICGTVLVFRRAAVDVPPPLDHSLICQPAPPFIPPVTRAAVSPRSPT